MSHGMAMFLNMLVWLAITAVVVGVPVLIIKALKEHLRRNKIKKRLQAEYGDGWQIVYDNMFSRRRKEDDMDADPMVPVYDRTQVFQRAPRPEWGRQPQTPVYEAPIEYNTYPTPNGAIHQALKDGSVRRGRDWFRGPNAYWAVKDEEIKQDPLIHGDPGVGLNASGFSQANIGAGQRGEKNLAKLMHMWGLTKGGVETFWSMALPNSGYDTDVDAIMVYGNTVYLIDAKNYSVGSDGETYMLDPRDPRQSTIVRVDQAGRFVPKSEHKLSQSMVMAVDKYTPYLRAIVPDVKVVAAVVLCPDKNGTPAVAPNLVTMMGKMPVMSCTDFLSALKIESAGHPANPKLTVALMPLLKSGDTTKNTTSQYVHAAPAGRPAQTKTYAPAPTARPVPSVGGMTAPPAAGPAASFTYDD